MVRWHELSDEDHSLSLHVATLRHEDAQRRGAKLDYNTGGLTVREMHVASCDVEVAVRNEHPHMTPTTKLFEEDPSAYLGSADFTYMGKSYEVKTHVCHDGYPRTMLVNAWTYEKKTSRADYLIGSTLLCYGGPVEDARVVIIFGCIPVADIPNYRYIKSLNAYEIPITAFEEIPHVQV